MASPVWVYYDGACGFCHGVVRWCLRRDVDGSRFRYAPIGGARWRGLYPTGDAPRNTFVLHDAPAAPEVRANASLALLRRLGGGWARLAAVLRVVPRPLRDAVYRLVAWVRRALRATPKDACPVLDPALRARFDLRP